MKTLLILSAISIATVYSSNAAQQRNVIAYEHNVNHFDGIKDGNATTVQVLPVAASTVPSLTTCKTTWKGSMYESKMNLRKVKDDSGKTWKIQRYVGHYPDGSGFHPGSDVCVAGYWISFPRRDITYVKQITPTEVVAYCAWGHAHRINLNEIKKYPKGRLRYGLAVPKKNDNTQDKASPPSAVVPDAPDPNSKTNACSTQWKAAGEYEKAMTFEEIKDTKGNVWKIQQYARYYGGAFEGRWFSYFSLCVEDRWIDGDWDFHSEQTKIDASKTGIRISGNWGRRMTWLNFSAVKKLPQGRNNIEKARWLYIYKYSAREFHVNYLKRKKIREAFEVLPKEWLQGHPLENKQIRRSAAAWVSGIAGSSDWITVKLYANKLTYRDPGTQDSSTILYRKLPQ